MRVTSNREQPENGLSVDRNELMIRPLSIIFTRFL